MKKNVLLVLGLCLSLSNIAQVGSNAPWMQGLPDNENLTFQEIVAAAEAYWATRDTEARGSGFKPYKRWEAHYKSFQNPDGTLLSRAQLWEVWNQKKDIRAAATDESNWQSIGPFDYELTGSWSAGVGRINAITVDPGDEDTYYIGAPAGGIWKTADAGATWQPLSDFLPQIGVSAIAVDPNAPNTIYIGTGDDDGLNTDGVGILKSTDGGMNWEFTGLNQSNAPFSVNEVYISPNDSNTLWASSSDGLFKTTNAGTTWNLELPGNIRDLKIKPGDPNTLYAASSQRFYRSLDGGDNWSIISSGTPSVSNTSRIVIDVTPANPEVVYLLAANNSQGFNGIYKSSNSGTSFTLTSTGAPDIFEVAQAWYDLAFAVSDTNENEIYTGVLNVWKSTNSGAAGSFSQVSSWSAPASPSYTHADIHMLRFFNGKLFCGSDGGIYISDNGGTTFDDRTAGIAIGQFYNLDVAQQSSQRISGGLQDNGGYELNNGVWQNYYGADGTDVAIDPQNPDRTYGFIQRGSLYFSNSGGASLDGFVGAPDNANFVPRMEISSTGQLYGGYTALYQLNASATAWNQLSPSFGQNIDRIALDPNNLNVIYIAINSTLRRSIDGGATFNIIHNFSSDITSIEVNTNDSNTIYVTIDGTTGNVYRGTISESDFTMEDITGSLPNIPKLVIKHQADHPDNPLFLGTRLGVWRYDDVTGDWETFDNNLPNTSVNDLEINYEDGILTAGTFGRGVWQSTIPQAPLALGDTETNDFGVYPNPSQGPFTLIWRNGVSAAQLTVYDISGRAVLHSDDIPQGSTNYTLNMEHFTSGIYFVEMTIDGVKATQKIIKK